MSRLLPKPNLRIALAIPGLLAVPAMAATDPPANVALTAPPLAGQASLTWTAATGATNYSVKRTTVATGPFSIVG